MFILIFGVFATIFFYLSPLSSPRFAAIRTRNIDEQTNELRYADRRMRVVNLNGNLQTACTPRALREYLDCILQLALSGN